MTDVRAAAWWPLTKKVRAMVAVALVGDAAAVASWLTDNLAGSAVVAGALISAAGAIAAYLTSDESSPSA